jgi:hypothetical protein
VPEFRPARRCGPGAGWVFPDRSIPGGGNGTVLDYDIGRFVADAEALYSYEGTNTLVVGSERTPPFMWTDSGPKLSSPPRSGFAHDQLS